MKKKKIIKIVLCSLLALVVAVSMFAGNYLVNYALGRSGDGGDRDVALEVEEAKEGTELVIQNSKDFEAKQTEAFLASHEMQTTSITSQDTSLVGEYFTQESDKWVILVHGYRGDKTGMEDLAPQYYAQGYNVLIPDLRACGESEGDYIGMGWTDRLDILEWINWIIEDNKDAQIVLHGISMGAATVMMTSGEDVPDNVKAYVEDCGYTTVWDVFSSELKLRFHLPEFPVLYTSQIVSQIKAGYGFKEASALKAVSQCDKPMMFIHGTNDDFIPFEMMDELYNAKSGDKEKMVAKEAGHGEARHVLGDDYWNGIFDFINQYVK